MIQSVLRWPQKARVTSGKAFGELMNRSKQWLRNLVMPTRSLANGAGAEILAETSGAGDGQIVLVVDEG